MTTRETSTQAPIAADIERARRDFRRERQLRFFRGLRSVLLIVVPLSTLIVFGDLSVANFLAFNDRAQQVEPKAVLRCLAEKRAALEKWSGRVSGELLRGPCFSDAIGYRTRPRFNYDYEARGGGALFAAVASDRGYDDMSGDLWVIDADLPGDDGAPVNCVDRVPVRGLFSRPRAPSTAAACIAWWATSPPALQAGP